MSLLLLRSQVYTIPASPASSSIAVDLSFLNASRAMTAPWIRSLRIVANALVTTGAGGDAPWDYSTIYNRVRLTDSVGERINVTGFTLRNILEAEQGEGFDPSDAAGIGPAAGPLPVQFTYELPFFPFQARRRRDFNLPAAMLYDGGDLKIDITGQATLAGRVNGAVINSGSFYVEAEIEEGRVVESKTRSIWREINSLQTDFNYKVGGFLRYALMQAGPIQRLAGTPWGAQQISSDNLNYKQVDSFSFQQRYAREHAPLSADDTTLPATDFIVPVRDAEKDQKTTMLPSMDTLHIRTSLASIPAGASLVMCILQSRSPAEEARTLGPAKAANVSTNGRIKAASGNPLSMAKVGARAASVLPVKVKAKTI